MYARLVALNTLLECSVDRAVYTPAEFEIVNTICFPFCVRRESGFKPQSCIVTTDVLFSLYKPLQIRWCYTCSLSPEFKLDHTVTIYCVWSRK